MNEPVKTPARDFWSLGDSVTVSGLIVSIAAIVLVPTFTVKIIGAMVLVALIVYAVLFSHFSRNLQPRSRVILAIVIGLIVLVAVGLNLRSQWRMSLGGPAAGTADKKPDVGQSAARSADPISPSTSVSTVEPQSAESSRKRPRSAAATSPTGQPAASPSSPTVLNENRQSGSGSVYNNSNVNQQNGAGSFYNNNSTVIGSQTINNVRPPLPELVDFHARPLPAIPPFQVLAPNDPTRDERVEEYRRSLGPEDGAASFTDAAGFAVQFRVSTAFTDPNFVVRCDQPCVGTSISYSRSRGEGVVESHSNLPAVLSPDEIVLITVRPQSKAHPITYADITPVQR